MTPPEEPAFQEAWQAEAYALGLLLQERGLIDRAEWSGALGAELARTRDDGSHYYEHWLTTLERLLAAKGILTAEALAERKAAWAEAAARTPHGQPIELANAAARTQPSS